MSFVNVSGLWMRFFIYVFQFFYGVMRIHLRGRQTTMAQ